MVNALRFSAQQASQQVTLKQGNVIQSQARFGCQQHPVQFAGNDDFQKTDETAQAGKQEPSAFKKWLKGGALAIMLGLAGLTGTACSPQQSSYWNNTFTELPAPPQNSRMQIDISSEGDGTVFMTYIVWSQANKQFERHDVHYNTTTLHPGTFSEMGGYKQKINDGEVLTGGVVVDQASGKLILPGGNLVDGKTGNVLDSAGKVIKEAQ